MQETLGRRIIRWGWILSLFLLISYLICIAFGLIAPESAHMHKAWAPLLPGFEWLTLNGFLAGAAGSFLYGWYIAVVILPLHHLFAGRKRV